jgi:hypothetical protein
LKIIGCQRSRFSQPAKQPGQFYWVEGKFLFYQNEFLKFYRNFFSRLSG